MDTRFSGGAMVMGKVRIFTQEEERIIHNYNEAKRLNMTVGLNEGSGTFEDVLVANFDEVRIDRNYMGDDGAFRDVEDVSEEYLDMVFMNGVYIGEVK
jgi:hypothetical protein